MIEIKDHNLFLDLGNPNSALISGRVEQGVDLAGLDVGNLFFC